MAQQKPAGGQGSSPVFFITILVLGVFALLLFNASKGAPRPNPQGVVQERQEFETTSEIIINKAQDGDCTLLHITYIGMNASFHERLPLQASPRMDAPSVQGLTVEPGKKYKLSAPVPRCDKNGNNFFPLELQNEQGDPVLGWVFVGREGAWVFTQFLLDGTPVTPVAWGQQEVAIQVVRVGGDSSCQPLLQSARFYYADGVDFDGSSNTDPRTGYWVHLTTWLGNERMLHTTPDSNSVPVVTVFAERGPGTGSGDLEMRQHPDGFRYACNEGEVWWSVRQHTRDSIFEGWVQEGDPSLGKNGLYLAGFLH